MNTFKFWNKITGLLIIMTFVTGIHATSVQEAVQQLTGEAAKQYVAPIVSAYGANLNAGWYHKAPAPKKIGFNVEVGAILMGTFLGGGKKTLSTTQSFQLDSAQASSLIGDRIDTLSGLPVQQQSSKKARRALIDTLRSQSFTVGMTGPTIIGSEDSSIKVKFTGKTFSFTYADTILGNPITQSQTTIIPDTTISMDGLTGVLGDFTSFPPLPLAAPQLTLGTVLGTNLTLRWLPSFDFGKTIGKIDFFGFGIQHNPAVWLGSPLPIDFCVGYFHQELSLGTLFDASTNAYGINASKTLGLRILNVTPYAGFQYETSTMSFHYDFEASQKNATTGLVEKTLIPIKFEMEGENNTRLTAGLSVRLFILNLNLDYNFAKYSSVSAGLMLGI